jgi:hypothetical protein
MINFPLWNYEHMNDLGCRHETASGCSLVSSAESKPDNTTTVSSADPGLEQSSPGGQRRQLLATRKYDGSQMH